VGTDVMASINLCKCGCGRFTKGNNVYINHHNRKNSKGQIAWNKGMKNPYTPETIKKMSHSHIGQSPSNKGKPMPPQVRAKIKFFEKGHLPWNTGTKGVMKGYWKGKKRPDISAKEKGRKVSEETKAKQKARKLERRLKGIKNKSYNKSPNYKHNDTVFKKGMTPWSKGKHLTEEHKAKVKATLKRKGIKPSNEARAKALHTNSKPTLPEIELGKLLQEACPEQYKYTGNGTFMVGNRFPDFVNINGKKKLVEMYGSYWHKNENIKIKIDEYKSYGFDCLIIWEHELRQQSKESLLGRIRSFNNG